MRPALSDRRRHSGDAGRRGHDRAGGSEGRLSRPAPSGVRVPLARARELVTRFAQGRIAVVGDLMIDRFIWGSVTRISPEAPVPIVREERRSASLGGAGNVARNTVALGGTAMLAGLVGEDADGRDLHGLCAEAGLRPEGLLAVPERPTTVKTRIVAHHQHVVRFDREEDAPVAASVTAALARNALAMLDQAQALVVSDYDKGAIAPALLEPLLDEASRRRIPVVVDPKTRLMDHYRPATVVTPNARETAEAWGKPVRTEEDLEAAGRALQQRLDGAWVLITRGERGMFLLPREGDPVAVPARAREVFDVSGAGDTVVATLALALAAGATMIEAVVLANHAAGVVVGKLGTAALSPAELLESVGEEISVAP
ncbi:MAG TPA: D-glycero-beta-D-manno-heptose-7-phosphate kinase [Candidatus Polarisedimenticolia bacterium]|nr:D-glycero-beta-D-manno-heptose-7-phosphate kinase [Candidatus Polarisedimenticolia bacterium]